MTEARFLGIRNANKLNQTQSACHTKLLGDIYLIIQGAPQTTTPA